MWVFSRRHTHVRVQGILTGTIHCPRELNLRVLFWIIIWLCHLKSIHPLWKILKMSSTGGVWFSDGLACLGTLFEIHTLLHLDNFYHRGYRGLNIEVSSETILLRVRAVFHKTVRICHVYCNFKIGFTVIFGTLKDGSLLINTLASNICFSYRNMFQNGVDALSKIVDAFLSKSSKFHLVRIIR